MWFDVRNKEKLKQLRDDLTNEPSCTREQVESIYKNILDRAKYLYGVSAEPALVWHALPMKVKCYAYYDLPSRSIHLAGDWLLCNGETFTEEVCTHEVAHAVQHMKEGWSNHANQFRRMWEELLCREPRREVLDYARVPEFYRYKVVCPNCGAVVTYRGKPRRQLGRCLSCWYPLDIQELLQANKEDY